MHVLSYRKLVEFWEDGDPQAAEPLRRWYDVAERAKWRNFAEIRADFPSADPVGECIVFNSGGNKYRIITHVKYCKQGKTGRMTSGRVHIKYVFTHADYMRGDWKRIC